MEASPESDESEIDEEIQHQTATTHQSKDVKAKKKEDGDLDRTVFINNLPFDATKEEVIEKFSLFGKVESFFPVLHKITRLALISFGKCPFCLLKGFTYQILVPCQCTSRYPAGYFISTSSLLILLLFYTY